MDKIQSPPQSDTNKPAISSLGLAILLMVKHQSTITCQNLFAHFEAYSPTLILKTVRYLITNQLLVFASTNQLDPPLLLTNNSLSYL
jgi:hypothetical protein